MKSCYRKTRGPPPLVFLRLQKVASRCPEAGQARTCRRSLPEAGQAQTCRRSLPEAGQAQKHAVFLRFVAVATYPRKPKLPSESKLSSGSLNFLGCPACSRKKFYTDFT